MMNKAADSNTTFKFMDSQLLLRRIRPNPIMLIVHNSMLSKVGLARYNQTRVEPKTFTFYVGSKSLSIDNAVLVPVHKHLLFSMVKRTDFIVSLENNPYKFQH